MNVIKGLRSLVRLKTRRVEQHEEALRTSKLQLQREIEQLEEVRAKEDAQRNAEQGVRDRLSSTTHSDAGFRPSDVVTLQWLLKEAEQLTADAVKQTAQAQGQVKAAQDHVSACDTALKRGQLQLERTQQRLKDAELAKERADEDAQDEEAEETSVARMLARTRTRAMAQARALQA
jgi:chromosome segregation ATPase